MKHRKERREEKTHRKSELSLTLSISLIVLLSIGTFNALHIAKAAFTTFDQYGPNVDQLQIKLYANPQVEFQDLELGALDMIDRPLSKYWIDRWTGDDRVIMQDYGGDIGMREFDINLNETKGICTAAGTDKSVMQPNIGRVFEFRHAVAHLVDRAYIITSILQGFGTPQYTFVPAALGGWVNQNVDKHLYSPSEAASVLAAGDIHDTDGDGCFDWPGTANGASNKIIVDFCLRIDDTPGRKEAGQRMIWELGSNIRSYSGGVGFQVNGWHALGSAAARKWVSEGKGFTIYTGGWSLNKDPDYLYDLFHSDMYWDPGRPPNVAHVADPELDEYLEGIKFAVNFNMVMFNTQEAQRVMADKVWVVPAWVPSAPKAVRADYTGGTNEALQTPDDGENQYRGKAWRTFVNQYGSGLNCWWSTFSAHVNDVSGGPMLGGVLRYGFQALLLDQLNPVYSEWAGDWEVLGRVYESLIRADPFDLSRDLEWLAKFWTSDLWTNPSNGQTGIEFVFELRNDVYWHDGQQFDADDVIFTVQDIVTILADRGLPPIWQYGSLMDVYDIVKQGQFIVKVRMNTISCFGLHLIGEIPILPEHMWRPIVTSGDPTVFAPDPYIIGAGPFKAYPHSIDEWAGDYYVPGQYVKLDAYKGYFTGSDPISLTMAVHGSMIDVYLQNLYEAPITLTSITATASGAALTPSNPAPTIPARSGYLPGFALVRFSGLSPPKREYTVTISVSYTIGARTFARSCDSTMLAPSVDGDITNDGAVNVLDAIHLSFHFPARAWTYPQDDIDASITINVLDALRLISYFGATAP